MIKANELRIGNWVIGHEDEALQLESISPFELGIFNFRWEWLKYIKLIPLTEEILLKCGAVKKDKYFEFKETLLRLTFNNGLWHCSIGDDKHGFMFRFIKYLHQLQNLYFALTADELEVI